MSGSLHPWAVTLVVAVFWQAIEATGETTGPLPDTRYLDWRLIDTFESWAPLR